MLLALHYVNVVVESISKPLLTQRTVRESWLKAWCDTKTNIAYVKMTGRKEDGWA